MQYCEEELFKIPHRRWAGLVHSYMKHLSEATAASPA